MNGNLLMNSKLRIPLRTRQLTKPSAHALLFVLVSLLIVVSTASAQQQGQQATVKPSPENRQPDGKAAGGAERTGAITGRVFADEGHPLANATIFAFGLNASGPPTGDTTDTDGIFELKNLRPGAYNVQVSSPGYVAVPEAGAQVGAQRIYRVGETVNFTLVKGGVITGTVTKADGQPVIAAAVRAIRVRKPTEQRTNIVAYSMPRMTDDRGSYRLYGLEPGVYIVVVGGGFQLYGNINAYEGDAPTYYPSATRDTAAELTVRAGEELTGIDVRYRGERGHAVSGFISGQTNDSSVRSGGVSITLLQATSREVDSFTFTQAEDGNRSFALNSVADGEYLLTAVRNVGETRDVMTATRKISVRGADVTGVELKLEPLGALSGNVVLEPSPKPDCANQRGSTLEEVVVNARQDTKAKTEEEDDPLALLYFRRHAAAPSAKGEFKLHNLRAGSYRFDVQLPGDEWYVRSITLPGAAAAPTPAAGARAAAQSKPAPPGAFIVRQGERIAGVTITIGQGAASVRGRVAQIAEGVQLPANLRLHLIPVEPERAADVLRYMEAAVESDGKFALGNIAPGRYWMLARVAPAASAGESGERRPVAFEQGERDRLRREAASADVKIDLQPCQRLADYVLNYGPQATPKQPSVK